jgi:hypothetical protein
LALVDEKRARAYAERYEIQPGPLSDLLSKIVRRAGSVWELLERAVKP